MLYRRLIAHTPRLFGKGRAEQRYRDTPHWEGVLILFFILFIMVGGLLYDAGHLVADDIHGNERDFAPLAAPVAAALGGLSRSSAQTVSEVGWWLHCVTILVFLSVLPLTKHFHIITAIPNVFLAKLPPRGVERPLAITQVPAAAMAALDSPTAGHRRRRLAGRPELEAGARRVLVHRVRPLHGRLPGHRERHPAGAASADPRPARSALPHPASSGRQRVRAAHRRRRPVVVHDLHGVRRGVPRGDRARADDRRHAPQRSSTRARWIRCCSRRCRTSPARATPTASPRACAPAGPRASTSRSPTRARSRCEYLWFVGDFASFDERVQLASQSIARILHDAGVSFGLLYEGERNAGNDVRRVGEEGLFEMLVEQNMGALADADYRGDLHHRPALAQHAAQRVSAVRPRQAGLPLHRAARRPRRPRRDLADGPR